MRFDITTLNLVHAIAQTRSITKGAERENLAIAAASKRLTDLECRIGVQLFVRQPRGVVATDAGEALIRHIRKLQNTLNALEREVAEYADGIKGKLCIGATAGAIAEWLPGDLVAFARRHPDIQISIEEMSSADGVQAVAEETIDVGIFKLPAQEARIDAWEYRRGRLGLLVPQGHPLEALQQVTLEDLLDRRLIFHSATGWAHDVLTRAARRVGKELSVRCYAREANTVAQLVQQGLGVAVISEFVARRLSESYRTRVVRLPDDWAVMAYSLCVPRRPHLPVVTQRFIEALVDTPAPSRELEAA